MNMIKRHILAIGPNDIAAQSSLTGSLYVAGTDYFRVYDAERFSGHEFTVQGTTGRPTQVFRISQARQR